MPAAPPGADSDFTWRDAGRTIRFAPGLLAEPRAALGTLAEHGFEGFALFSTPRALAEHPRLADQAAAVHHVEPGQVPDAAAALLEEVGGAPILALGGGRVIDTAKAIAAVSGVEVAAAPTTMSGAEMTGIHRLPAGAGQRARGLVRPSLVLADPLAMTSQEEPALRASSINALAHGADSLCTPLANPVSRMCALRGAGLIAAALDEERGSRGRAALALGSLLCGYAIDSALFALHHVVCQTLVRVCGSSHAETNAAVLPRTMAAMRSRAPEDMAGLAEAIGCSEEAIEERILELGGDQEGLGAAGADASRLEEALDAIEARPELAFTPDPPGRDELRAMIEAAW
ncbi:MAG: iron-containing alcohol dehydrogenase [Solirubrobacterales bacterium]